MPQAAMDSIAPGLMWIFRSRCGDDVAAAGQWARRIHGAFYSAKSSRGSSKFLALESALTEVFGNLSSIDDACAFWQFVVLVVLALAQEPAVQTLNRSPQCDGYNTKIPVGKKSAKKCQPNAPLAFLVVNALKKLIKGDVSNEQVAQCRLQGKHNEELRGFCKRGLSCNSDVDQKLLVELLELFQITDIDQDLVHSALERLLESKSHAALIKLCGTFTDVDWPFDMIVLRMVRAKDWTSAELLVRTYEADGDTVLAKLLINETIHLRDFKRAHRLVLSFKLQEQYPDIDVLYSRDGLMRLIETQRWQLALTFVGHETTLQKVLLEHMVAAGELAWAAQLVEKMVATGFDPDISQIIESLAKANEQASCSSRRVTEAKEYLTLSLDVEDVVFCNSEASVRQAAKHFLGSTDYNGQPVNHSGKPYRVFDQVVGLDVEWKPVTLRSKSRTTMASILQIASPTQVFIIDLLALHDNDYLFDNFLQPLFTSSQFLKLGFSFESDLKVLHQTFPEREAFATVAPFLDLNAFALNSGGSVGSSLSHVVSRILGKPLNKGMQLSDWEQRPLSPEQLTYAALDAFCLVQVTVKLNDQTKDDISLPSWQEACDRINNLSYMTSLTAAEISDATSQRNEYHKKWLLRCAAEKAIQDSTYLVTPQHITRLWKGRQANTQICDDLNTTLKFLPMSQIEMLLEETVDPQKPRNFIAVNSICIFTDAAPCVVCIDASCKLDVARFARFCGIGRRKVRLATETECREVFGFAPGTVAPFGHRSQSLNSGEVQLIKVYADSSLLNALYLAAGCGAQDEVLWVESKALFALTSIEVVGDNSTPRDSTRQSTLSPLSTDFSSGLSNAKPDEATQEEPKPLEYKFLADSMVTQVGRWLRTIGVDVVNWNPDDVQSTRIQDPKSIMLARAARDDRIVLTRDTSLPGRRDAGACFVLSDHECYKQFREVKVQFGLLERMDTRASRCARCNSAKFSPIDAVSARQKVSERVRKKVPTSVTKFWICNNCSKVYWQGPKYARPSKPSADGSVVYRPVPRKRVARDKHDQRHLPDP